MYVMKNKDKVEEHITWKLSSGSCSFWWDDWLGGVLARHTSGISSLNNTNVAQFWVNGVFDTTIWRPTETGKFTCASAWEICRHGNNIAGISAQIWHKYIPFKMSFLLWRALRKKLPTNEKLGNFGVEPVRCFCSYQQGWDEVEHIFLQGLEIKEQELQVGVNHYVILEEYNNRADMDNLLRKKMCILIHIGLVKHHDVIASKEALLH
ncbi:hypothetical protein MTR67_026228 [Solanum verrucosum]|uniref:Reverse transcriptase zinc-binding domain-containing protein n=1 Tax=Solanum verrucosum TaxID=315347 RepID=A0AAF0TZP1_SOLVR|nr:hypothetical protein MTR67_026228 [Solanum verrucosum]